MQCQSEKDYILKIENTVITQDSGMYNFIMAFPMTVEYKGICRVTLIPQFYIASTSKNNFIG